MELLFEHVYTIDEWHAGPRAGVANFAGVPHFFRAVSRESEAWSADEDRFELIPLSPELLAMMLEASALLHRWHAGPRTGAEPPADEPDTTGERGRYAELERQIADALAVRLPIAVMRGQFDFDPDRVRWAPVGSGRVRRDAARNN
jgi:hypothetical protein